MDSLVTQLHKALLDSSDVTDVIQVMTKLIALAIDICRQGEKLQQSVPESQELSQILMNSKESVRLIMEYAATQEKKL